MLRIGLIGVGNMGRNHLRVLARMPERAMVTAIVDPALNGEKLPGIQGRVLADLAQAFDLFDAAIIAAPTALHYDLGMVCLAAGKHVFIEKPLAANLVEGAELVAQAKAYGRILQVGHIERFNPAVRMVKEIIGDEKIVALEASRLSYFQPADSYENLVIDLMIHDIDVALSVFGNMEPERVFANAYPIGTPRDALHVNAILQFPQDHIAALHTSRLAHEKARILKLYTPERTIQLDYITREIRVSRWGQATSIKGVLHGYHVETHNDYFVVDGEPLQYELEHFLDCLEGGHPPEVDGEAGLRALKVAFAVIEGCG